MLAIGLAVILGATLLVFSLGGSLETYAGPGELAGKGAGSTYRLNGTVARGAPPADEAADLARTTRGLSFTVVDKQNPDQTVRVVYRGQVPDQFKGGREIVVTGAMQSGVFEAKTDSLVTLCPSKFTDRPDDSSV